MRECQSMHVSKCIDVYSDYNIAIHYLIGNLFHAFQSGLCSCTPIGEFVGIWSRLKSTHFGTYFIPDTPITRNFQLIRSRTLGLNTMNARAINTENLG